MNQNGSNLNVFRGLTRAVLCALAGVVVSVATLSSIAVCQWYAWGANAFDWQDAVQIVANAIPSVIPGFAAVFGATGWATYAPRGKFRFTKTLSIIFVVSLPLWFLVWYAAEWIGLAPRQSKEDRSQVEFAGLLVSVTVPILAAAVLTAIRIHTGKPNLTGDSPTGAEPSGAP